MRNGKSYYSNILKPPRTIYIINNLNYKTMNKTAHTAFMILLCLLGMLILIMATTSIPNIWQKDLKSQGIDWFVLLGLGGFGFYFIGAAIYSFLKK